MFLFYFLNRTFTSTLWRIKYLFCDRAEEFYRSSLLFRCFPKYWLHQSSMRRLHVLLLVLSVLVATLATKAPTASPTAAPTATPTITPVPTPIPTADPTEAPTYSPTRLPTGQPTSLPSGQPTVQPTSQPSRQPTTTPTQWKELRIVFTKLIWQSDYLAYFVTTRFYVLVHRLLHNTLAYCVSSTDV